MVQRVKWESKAMSLHQLRLFCAVVEQGSYTLAAQLLYLSQPAVSIQVKRLEKFLGVRLLQSSRNRVVPTEAGSVLYNSARAILEQESIVRLRLASMRKRAAGAVVVGVTATGALSVVAMTIKRFRTLYPDVHVSLHVDMREAILGQLQTGTLDIAVEWLPIDQHGVEVTPLATVDFGAILPPDHPLAAAASLPRQDLKRLPYLSLLYGLGKYSHMEATLLRAGLISKIAMRLPTIESLKQAVEAGLGVTVVSPFSVRREVAAGFLKWVLLKDFPLRRTMVAIARRSRHKLPQVQAFSGMLAEMALSQGGMEVFSVSR